MTISDYCKYVLKLDKFFNLKSAAGNKLLITGNSVGNVKSTVKFVMYRLQSEFHIIT